MILICIAFIGLQSKRLFSSDSNQSMYHKLLKFYSNGRAPLLLFRHRTLVIAAALLVAKEFTIFCRMKLKQHVLMLQKIL